MPAVMPDVAPQGDDEEIDEMSEPVQLTRDLILAAEDLPMERVEVPEWGGFVYVRTLTGKERDKYEDECFVGKGRKRVYTLRGVRARLAVLSACDEAGRRLFSDTDVGELGKRSCAALDRVFEVAQRLSGVTDEDVEDLAKNSETTPGDSGSGE